MIMTVTTIIRNGNRSVTFQKTRYRWRSAMAELILTPEEQDAALWTDLDDAALGAIVRRHIVTMQEVSTQMDRTIEMSAAILLCFATIDSNGTAATLNLEGLTRDGIDHGNWTVFVRKRGVDE